jgi:hypothetical protein
VCVPLIHRAGDEAQVDFFEVTVKIAVFLWNDARPVLSMVTIVS